MKFETKLNKILAIEDKKLRLSKLYGFALSLFPNSPIQLKVRNEINQLIKES